MNRLIHVLTLTSFVIVNQQPLAAQWVQTKGPGVGVGSLSVTGTTLIAGTGAGVFVSDNGGTSWMAASVNLGPNTDVFALVAGDTNVFAVAGTYADLVGNFSTVFRSSDTSWNAVWEPTGLKNVPIFCLLVDGENLFVGSINLRTNPAGVYRSTDNGATWTIVESGLPWGYVSALALIDTVLFASSGSGVYVSTDGGSSWSAAGTPFRAFSQMLHTETRVLAGTDSGVFLSTDNGAHWTQTSLDSTWVTSFVESGSNVFAGTQHYGVFCSADSGMSWTAVNTGLTYPFIDALAVIGTDLFAAAGGDVFHSSDNGNNWEKKSDLLRHLSVGFMAVSPGGELWASVYEEVPEVVTTGLFLSRDGDDWWPIGLMGGPAVRALGYNASGIGFAGTDDGIFRINAFGEWTRIDSGLTDLLVGSLAVTSQGHVFAATHFDGVFRSVDNGDHWTAVNSNIVAGAVAVSPNDDIYAGASEGVYHSTDDGDTWTLLPGSPRTQRLSISPSGQIFVLRGGPDTLLLKSTNNGESWEKTDAGLPLGAYSHSVTSLVFDRYGNAFAGIRMGGVFCSSDNGMSWKEIDEGLSASDISSLSVDSTYVYAATQQGVWKRRLSEISTSVTHDLRTIPEALSLLQNYPNPFNPATTIRFTLRTSLSTTLTIYNILGEQVATLLNEKLDAGAHSVTWDATGFPSGVYFYRLATGGFVETKKLVLMR